MIIRDFFEGRPPAHRGANSQSLGFLRHKTPIFGAEGAENFEKCRGFKEKFAIFGVLRENRAKF